MTIFLLIRHGLNDHTGKRLIGRAPGVHLNQAGMDQALKLAQALQKYTSDSIYSSPLERAVETAEPFSKASGIPIRLTDGLAEVDFGSWQGLTVGQMRRRKLFKAVQSNPASVTFPNGESFAQAQIRVVRCLEELAARHGEKACIACFSHCDVIRLAIAGLIGLPLDEFQHLSADTGSISVIEYHDHRGNLRLLNNIPA